FGIVHRGRVRVEGADVRILFLSPVGPMWRDANDPVAVPRIRPIVDGWVRGRGILVKNFIDDTTGPATPVLLLVATNLERDYELRPVRGLNDVPFDDIVDDPVGANTPEGRAIMAKEFPRALYRLLKYAESRAGAAGSELRQQEKLKPRSFRQEAEYQELVGNAKAHRAEYFGALGVIALEPLHYTAGTITPNDAGVTECLNGWILTDQQKLIQFIAPGRLAGAWPKRTRIRFEGYYYKCKLYQARNGTDRLAPVFVLTVLDEIIPPPPDRTAQFAVAGLFVAGLAALFFLIMREDKTKDSFRRARRKRRTVA
ncbi:MAG: hypothetical protein OER88_10490, partial [Planctomycetota bacterium]|nr:hypothetical protein [Planctomycetota bacterium]